MHIPDGFIDLETSAAFAGAAVIGVGAALRGARKQLDDQSAPLAGLTAVFIFAVQMLNFPVAAGTSGHLLGGALAAVLVGPYAASLALTVVNMSIIGVWSGYFIFVLIKKIAPKKKSSIVVAGALAAFISVPLSAAGFVLQYALGGTATFSITTVLGAMISTHILIGIGEALITGLTVSAVLATRPDLVFGYKGAKQNLEIRTSA